MSIATQISRIQGEKSKIAIKLSDMGLVESTANLETLATAIEKIPNKGAVTATVRQGESYTIPAGYHNGSGTVTGLDNPEADASKYMLQTKTITPTKSQQSVTADQGYYGLSSVTVNAIPTAYQNVTQVDATASDVLAGKKIVSTDGTVVVGTMANNGAVSKTLDMSLNGQGQYSNSEYTVPKGYHNGSGKVKIAFETQQSVTPDDTSHTITPSSGKVLSTVYVEPIPSDYVAGKTQGTATAADILDGKTAYVNGAKVTGNIPVRSALGDVVVNGLTLAAPAGYYAEDIVETAIDENLTAGNIKSGVSIFGVAGSFTDDGTAGASHIMKDYTAYVKGKKVTGTMPTYGAVESTVEWTDFSNAPYFSQTFQGYVSGVNVTVDTSDLENALSEI